MAHKAPAKQGQGPHPIRQSSTGGMKNQARYRRRIPDLRPGEVVIALLHRHPASLLPLLAWPIVLALLWMVASIWAVPFIASLQFVDPILAVNAPPAWLAPLLWVLWFGLVILFACWAIYTLFDWREDWIALTTRRVIVMNKTLFLRETRRECPIGKVQNVIAAFPNPIGMTLDFGDLIVDTAGAGALEFKHLPHPKTLREAIFKQQKLLQANQPQPEDIRRQAVRSIILGRPVTGDQQLQLPADSQSAIMAPVMDHNPQRYNSQSSNRIPGSSVSGYGLFNSLFPFAAQRDGARVTWHRHWSYLLRGVSLPVLLYVIVTGGWLASLVLGEPGSVGLIETLLGWTSILLSPVCAGWILWSWEDWRNDLYKLDHERVYHTESLPFGLREQSKETLISRISDVMYEVPGPVANLLNYGNVVIKTPGEAAEFDFKGIPCPREVQREIMERVDEYRQKSAAGADKEIEAWIKAYHDVTRGA